MTSVLALPHLFFFSSRRRHTRWPRDWSSDVCSSDLALSPLSPGAFGLALLRTRLVGDRARPGAVRPAPGRALRPAVLPPRSSWRPVARTTGCPPDQHAVRRPGRGGLLPGSHRARTRRLRAGGRRRRDARLRLERSHQGSTRPGSTLPCDRARPVLPAGWELVLPQQPHDHLLRAGHRHGPGRQELVGDPCPRDRTGSGGLAGGGRRPLSPRRPRRRCPRHLHHHRRGPPPGALDPPPPRTYRNPPGTGPVRALTCSLRRPRNGRERRTVSRGRTVPRIWSEQQSGQRPGPAPRDQGAGRTGSTPPVATKVPSALRSGIRPERSDPTMASNSSIAARGGCGVIRLTTTANTRQTAKPGTISYRCWSPNRPMATSGSNMPHQKATPAPPTMPTPAPNAVRRRQNSDSRMIGPKAAPKPAHAKATRPSTELPGSSASTTAITETVSTPMRPPHRAARSLSFTPTPATRSSIRAELLTMSWEEMVDVIAASTAASSTPAMRGWNRICARSRKTDSPLVVSVSSCGPFCWK